MEQLRQPHVKHLGGKLWELRAKASEDIARGIYVTVLGRLRRRRAPSLSTLRRYAEATGAKLEINLVTR